MYLYSRHEKIRLLLPRIYTLYCSIWGKHFDASETWHDQIKVKEMEEIITISLQTEIVISLYLGAAIKQNRQTKSVFSLTKHMRDIRQVIRKAKASHWGRWRATGESTTSGARHGLPDYEPYVKHCAESKRKNGRGCKILLNKAPVQGDYFLEFESVESCPIHFSRW